MTELLNHTILLGNNNQPLILLQNNFLIGKKKDDTITLIDFCKNNHISIEYFEDTWVVFSVNEGDDTLIIINNKLGKIIYMSGANYIRETITPRKRIIEVFTEKIYEMIKEGINTHTYDSILLILILQSYFKDDFFITTIDDLIIVYSKKTSVLVFIHNENNSDNILDSFFKFEGVTIRGNEKLRITEHIQSLIEQIYTQDLTVFGKENIETVYYLTKTVLLKCPSLFDTQIKIKALNKLISEYEN